MRRLETVLLFLVALSSITILSCGKGLSNGASTGASAALTPTQNATVLGLINSLAVKGIKTSRLFQALEQRHISSHEFPSSRFSGSVACPGGGSASVTGDATGTPVSSGGSPTIVTININITFSVTFSSCQATASDGSSYLIGGNIAAAGTFGGTITISGTVTPIITYDLTGTYPITGTMSIVGGGLNIAACVLNFTQTSHTSGTSPAFTVTGTVKGTECGYPVNSSF